MKNIIFDVSAIVAFYQQSSDVVPGEAKKVINENYERRWLYVAEFSAIMNRLPEINSNLATNKFPNGGHLIRDSAALLHDYEWLSSLAADVCDCDDSDPIAFALTRAAKRLGKETLVITVDPRRINRGFPFVDFHGVLKYKYKNSIEFIDLALQQDRIRSRLEVSMSRVLTHGKYAMGPEVEELEKRLSDYVGVSDCICVSSGTDAILIALMALGIGNGDEVITSPFTFFAPSEMIKLLGAEPVYVDIDQRTFNLDANGIEEAITSKTRAILPVSLYGQCADMDKINAIAAQHGIYVVEDAAQSFGATYKRRKSCSLSEISCTSFYPAKPLGAYGEGGACFTSNPKVAAVLREIRDHGQSGRYKHIRLGINGRMDTLQAAVLITKLEVFDQELEERDLVAEKYTALFQSEQKIVTPHIEEHNTSSWAQYTVQLEDRDKTQEKLSAEGIPSVIHYPLASNNQPILALKGSTFSNCDNAARRVLSLPMHPYLTDSQQTRIANALKVAVAN